MKDCLLCRKPIPFARRLRNQKFCSDEHREQYVARQEENALGELLERTMLSSARRETSPAEAEDTKSEVVAEVEPPAVSEVERDADYGKTLPPAATDKASGESGAALETEGTEITEGEDSEAPGDQDEMAERYAEYLSILDLERQFYQDILDRLPAAVGVLGDSISVKYSNPEFRRLLERRGDMLAQESVRACLKAVLAGDAKSRKLSVTQSGDTFDVRVVQLGPEADSNGQAMVFVGPPSENKE